MNNDKVNAMMDRMGRFLDSAEKEESLPSYERAFGAYKMLCLVQDEMEEEESRKVEEIGERLQILVYRID